MLIFSMDFYNGFHKSVIVTELQHRIVPSKYIGFDIYIQYFSSGN